MSKTKQNKTKKTKNKNKNKKKQKQKTKQKNNKVFTSFDREEARLILEDLSISLGR